MYVSCWNYSWKYVLLIDWLFKIATSNRRHLWCSWSYLIIHCRVKHSHHCHLEHTVDDMLHWPLTISCQWWLLCVMFICHPLCMNPFTYSLVFGLLLLLHRVLRRLFLALNVTLLLVVCNTMYITVSENSVLLSTISVCLKAVDS